MTTQEAYDKIRAYFSKPGAQFAVDQEQGLCRYRVFEEGTVRKCAVGVLIPDKLYKPDMEGDTVDGVLSRIGGTGDAELLRFCELAQLAHDEQAFAFGPDRMPAFIRELDDLARTYDLKVPAAS